MHIYHTGALRCLHQMCDLTAFQSVGFARCDAHMSGWTCWRGRAAETPPWTLALQSPARSTPAAGTTSAPAETPSPPPDKANSSSRHWGQRITTWVGELFASGSKYHHRATKATRLELSTSGGRAVRLRVQ
eukprot:6075076-Pyramimonas_sp.AAC.3